MSIHDISPFHLALSYLSDVVAVVVRRSALGKEPLFPSRSTDKDANNFSQDRSNNVSTTSQASPGQLDPKKTLAATLVDSTKRETVALVPFDIARLAQRFYPLFNCLLFPRKPPPAAMVHRVLFIEAEDGLLDLGILEYNSDRDAIQKHFLPCKSIHQIYVRKNNHRSSNAPDNPVKMEMTVMVCQRCSQLTRKCKSMTCIDPSHKIPKKIVHPLKLESNGAVVLAADNTEEVQGHHSPCSNGRMLISTDAWAKFAQMNGFQMGQVVMFLFHPYGEHFSSTRGAIITADLI